MDGTQPAPVANSWRREGKTSSSHLSKLAEDKQTSTTQVRSVGISKTILKRQKRRSLIRALEK